MDRSDRAGAAGFLPLYLSLAEFETTVRRRGYGRAICQTGCKSSIPNSADARLLLAEATNSVPDFKTASALFEQARQTESKRRTLLERLAASLQGQGDLAGAEAQYDAALKVQHDSATALTGLVRVYLAQKRPDKAIQRVNEADSAVPTAVGISANSGTSVCRAEGQRAGGRELQESQSRSIPIT